MSGGPAVVSLWRGRHLDAVHHAAVCCVRGDSELLARGDVAAPQLVRSAAKPFQALAALGVMDAAGFAVSDEELAVMAGSHSGTARHVTLVRGLLARADLGAGDLRCGVQEPLGPEVRRLLIETGTAPTPLHHNCSGKHAGMLIAARLRGEDTAGYLDPAHPAQRRCRELLARFAGLDPDQVGVEVDGCGVAAFALPTRAMARAFACLGESDEAGAARIVRAIAAHPLCYSGEDRLETRLIERTGGRVVAKGGAEGYLAACAPGSGLGLALKVMDGAPRAVEPLGAALLLRLADLPGDARARLEPLAAPERRNWSGTLVGRIEVRL